MENCTLRTIENFNELEPLFKKASETDHPNAKNFLVEKMQKRWNKYLQFSVLEHEDTVISFAGIFTYGNNLVRVADRLFTFSEFRQKTVSKNVVEKLRPAVDYFIPSQTTWAKAKGYDCFYSIGANKKRRAMERVASLLDQSLGYAVLPGYYATCNPALPKCWQTVACTNEKISLPRKLDVEFV
tara:strand:- start:664 stop:1215 length:552 start_codon:yes stop_codon:yes gene_type:complete